jgi:hypothetical protein
MIREYTKVMKFAESSPELYTAFRDYANHVMAERGVKGKTFSEISLDEKEQVINKLFAEEIEKRSGLTVATFDGSFARYGTNPLVRSFADSIADYMIDMILPETLIQSIGMIADFRFGGFGDSFSFDIENNALFTVSKAGRRQRTAPAQRLTNTTVTLAPENHMVTVASNLPNILAGRESIAKFVMKAVRSIESTMLYEAYDAFYTAMESASMPANLTVANYTETALIELCQRVTAYNGGRRAIIAGTAVALKSVLPSSLNTRILLSDEYVTAGSLRTFNGVDVLEMVQVADYTSNDYSMKLKDDRIYVISPASDKLVKVAVEGESLTHTDNSFDNANLSVFGTLNKSWATAVISNSIAGVIKL